MGLRKHVIVLGVVAWTQLWVGCSPNEATHSRVLAGRLRSLYQDWARDGRPENVDTDNYITASKDDYLVFTNVVAVGTNLFHCRFAVRSPGRFARPGVLAISDEGVILWVGDKGGDVIVAPDKADPMSSVFRLPSKAP